MASALAARLLYAAAQTYGIIAAGPVPADPPRSDAIGYGTPDGFVSGPDAIDAGLIGEAPDGIIVAFRGTLPPDSPNHAQVIRDWLNDLNADLVPEPGLPGLVHRGFRNSLNNLWGAMWPQIQARATASPLKPVYITGHSKGGAMVHLAAPKCRSALDALQLPNQVIACSFAAARSGDQGFADGYAKAVGNSTRYEYGDDIVPHVPPSNAFRAVFQDMPYLADILPNMVEGYVSVGEPHFIDWSGALVADSPFLRVRRFAHLAERIAAFDFAAIVAAHGIGPGSGYAKAVGPEPG